MFFDATPNFLYPDFKVAGKYKLSKNLFRRVRTRDSFNAIYTVSTTYTIQEGETPDSIAYSKFGDSEWFWTILIINNITDMNTMWPMTSEELNRYIANKYGSYENKPRHWETTEVKDLKQNVVIEGGIIVEMFQDKPEQNDINYKPKIFVRNTKYSSSISPRGSTTITLGDVENLLVGDILDSQYLTKIISINGNTITIDKPLEYSIDQGFAITFSRYQNWFREYTYSTQKDNSGNITTTVKQIATADTLREVTNREYEYELNELKKEIKLPRSRYLQLMQQELEKLMEYDTTYKITEEGYRMSESV